MSPLRNKIIRLAYAKPSLRPHLLPLLTNRVAGEPTPLEVWESSRPIMRAAITPAFLLKIKRSLRMTPPEVFNLFNLYNWLQKSAAGAPIPDGGFQSKIKEGVVALSRSLPRVMSRDMAKEVASVLKGTYARVVMPIKMIDKGRGSKRNFVDVSDALANGLATALNSAGLPTEIFAVPGSVKFLGLRPSQPEGVNPPVPEDVAQSFTPEEESLPPKAYQNTKDINKLYESVEQAEELQLDLLNRGTGLDSRIGAKVLYPGEDKTEAMAKPGPVILIGPRKKPGRVIEKVTKEKEDVDSALDLVRATVAVDSLSDMPRIVDLLREMGIEFARKPKNRFNEPTSVNYRDLMFNIRYPNGHIGELQVNVKALLEAKDIGHPLYERVRKIEATKEKEGNRALTLEEQQTVDTANAAQRALYDEAWRQASGAIGGGSQKFAMEKTDGPVKYFEYEDKPAVVRRGYLPVIITSSGEEVVVYDQRKFYREATYISETEYKFMVESLISPVTPSSRRKSSMSTLRSKVIRLAHANPALRPHLLPLLTNGSRTATVQKLPDDPWRYFKKVPGAIMVNLKDLTPIRARESGIANANKYMWMAYNGEMEKRKPISLKDNGDGTYTVLDGNSTYANAMANNWKQIPGVVEEVA